MIGHPVKPEVGEAKQPGSEVEVETGTAADARTSVRFGNVIETVPNVPVVSPTMTAVEAVFTPPKTTAVSTITSAPLLFVKIS